MKCVFPKYIWHRLLVSISNGEGSENSFPLGPGGRISCCGIPVTTLTWRDSLWTAAPWWLDCWHQTEQPSLSVKHSVSKRRSRLFQEHRGSPPPEHSVRPKRLCNNKKKLLPSLVLHFVALEDLSRAAPLEIPTCSRERQKPNTPPAG